MCVINDLSDINLLYNWRNPEWQCARLAVADFLPWFYCSSILCRGGAAGEHTMTGELGSINSPVHTVFLYKKKIPAVIYFSNSNFQFQLM